jgi:hypothetical protein
VERPNFDDFTSCFSASLCCHKTSHYLCALTADARDVLILWWSLARALDDGKKKDMHCWCYASKGIR